MTDEQLNTEWWEKTVEYKFILSAKIDYGLDFLAPLAGNPESIADTLTRTQNKFYIIEFKSQLSEFKSEYDKFKDKKEETYINVGLQLCGKKGYDCHYVIYGSLPDRNKELELIIRKYFETKKDLMLTKKHYFSNGMTAKEFEEYTMLFTKGKRTGNINDDDDDGDIDRSSAFTRSLVLAHNGNGEALLMPISYARKLIIKEANKNTDANTNTMSNTTERSPRGRRM